LKRDGVATLIGRLHTYQDVVSHAYHNGEIIKNDENARGVEHLQQHKVLIPRAQDTFTLHSMLRRFFDASLNVERLYLIGSDVGSAFERLEKLADDLFDASHEGRIEAKESLEDLIHDSVYEISDMLSADLAHLRALVENRFAAVSTLTEKQRQNAYYIGRTEKVVKAIELFALSDLGERMQTQAPFANVAAMFTSQLIERLPSFRQNLLDILGILQNYLFEFRQIEERTKRVRSMWLFMERHPLYELKDWGEEHRPPAWLMKSAGLGIKAHPWVREPSCTDDLANLAKDIAPPTVRLPVTRQRGTLTLEGEVAVDLEPKLYQQAVAEMMEACRQNGISQSAATWFKDHPGQMRGMTLPLWVQCVLEELYRPKARQMGLQVEPHATPFEVFDGNVLVTDVVISVAP